MHGSHAYRVTFRLTVTQRLCVHTNRSSAPSPDYVPGETPQKMEQIGGAKNSLDHKIYSAVCELAGKKGLRYQADALDY